MMGVKGCLVKGGRGREYRGVQRGERDRPGEDGSAGLATRSTNGVSGLGRGCR